MGDARRRRARGGAGPTGPEAKRFNTIAASYDELARRQLANCRKALAEQLAASARGEVDKDEVFTEQVLDVMGFKLAHLIDKACAHFARQRRILSDGEIDIVIQDFRNFLGTQLQPHERGEILDRAMLEIDNRALLASWSDPGICECCGRFVPRPQGTDQAIALVRAGKRDDAITLMRALLERLGSTQH
jgi:hypothetical protein